MQAILLAGGKGSRLGERTRHMPKPLLLVGGQPFIFYLLENLSRFGFKNIILLVGPYLNKYKEILGSIVPSDITINFIPENIPAGTAGAITYAKDYLEDEFLLLNGDSYFDFDYLEFISRQANHPWLVRLALRKTQDSSRYGSVDLDGDIVTQFHEKHMCGPSLINAGVYWVRKKILTEITSLPCSLENDILPDLSNQGLVNGYVYNGLFIDIGTPDDLQRADFLMANRKK